ncbi:MAG: 2-C-methyl-D-erythritol 2,4-cyclodiphosphate synthase [Firmicutes bacterium]|nr:2-C-methyl-D-erythritol 2,4-cyclodiphosphate synthase [Bacillota bacterium]
MKIGIGFDAHAFTPGRPLLLGGVEIPFELGLAGHSDADVLLHAIADALLGAAGKRDLGCYFPDTDPKWAGASSINILAQVGQMVKGGGYRIINIDSVLIAQRPRLSPYIDRMRAAIATALAVKPEQITVKATSTEKLGFTGREEGIAAQAICLLCRSS